MALARPPRFFARFPPLTQSPAIPARLLATTLLAMLAGPIPAGRLPPRPSPGRPAAGFATVPRQRMMRRKPLLAPLQQTDPRTAMGRGLPSRPSASMLKKDHGSCCSRRSSPGVELPTPLRDAFHSSPPAHLPSVHLNHPAPALPPLPAIWDCRITWLPLAAIRSRAARRTGAAKLAPYFAATNSQHRQVEPRPSPHQPLGRRPDR